MDGWMAGAVWWAGVVVVGVLVSCGASAGFDDLHPICFSNSRCVVPHFLPFPKNWETQPKEKRSFVSIFFHFVCVSLVLRALCVWSSGTPPPRGV